MTIREIIKQKFMLLVALATVVGFSAFKAIEKKLQTSAIFVYTAPDNDRHSGKCCAEVIWVDHLCGRKAHVVPIACESR
ncbi:MAG TPA: hypothetical protein PKA53_09280 [Sphingobacterium sp.]|nr:hypothetical protein [Sphingobacterium sp.]